MSATINIYAAVYASDIGWQVDSMLPVGPNQYDDNSDNSEVLCLEPGAHTFTYSDDYGDGWDGGSWDIVLTFSGEQLAAVDDSL